MHTQLEGLHRFGGKPALSIAGGMQGVEKLVA